MGARLIVQFWRDIPVSVCAQHARTRHEVALPKRFARTVELAAGAPITAVNFGWWSHERLCTDDLELEVTSEVCRLESVYSRQKLARLGTTNGFDEYKQRTRLQIVQAS